MTQQVLILGGRGRIGLSVATDLLAHTSAQVIVTGRQDYPDWQNPLPADRSQFQIVNLADQEMLRQAIASVDLVIHCAGPFHDRNGIVLATCIAQGVNYLDVSDHVGFTRRALALHGQAKEAGVTAIINTGVFPGISNSMVRQGIEQLEQPEEIHLSYVVGGSGGAGLTVLRTTFLGLGEPFPAWIDGQWQRIKPYSDRQPIHLPSPFGKQYVYWYEMPETFTLAETFPVNTVITRFGSMPDLYNHLTWMTAHLFPKSWLRQSQTIEFLSKVSYRMTQWSDRFSGVGVGIDCQVTGQQAGQKVRYQSTLVHENTATAAGYGTGSIAKLVLDRQLQRPGVWPVEAALSTDEFQRAMQQRGVSIDQAFLTAESEVGNRRTW
jgi:saccharopine dehydrogenase-like NADP-dependent oxidoreductase